ncbi:MAG: hypothetical protein ACLUAV_05740 [Christensenellaceae bacterium]
MDIKNALLHQFNLRLTGEQKNTFLAFARGIFSSFGLSTALYTSRSRGIRLTGAVAGSADSAEYVIAAYYDTPRRRLVATPRIISRRVSTGLISAMPAILLFFISLLFWRAGAPFAICECAFLVCLFAIYYLAPNTTNANFSSSGLLALFSLARSVQRGVSYALLDGADLPADGISSLYKSYASRLDGKTVILLGNVGVGRRICVGYPKGDEALRTLAEDIAGADGFVYVHKKTYLRVDCAKKTDIGYAQFNLRTQKDVELSDDAIEHVSERIAMAIERRLKSSMKV